MKAFLFNGEDQQPSYRRCGAEEVISTHVLCDHISLASPKHMCQCFFLLEPEDVEDSTCGGDLEL